MDRLRKLVGLSVALVALVAWGCSSDDGGDQPAAAQVLASGFQIASPNFQEEVRPRIRIPSKNTCYGENLSPPLHWSGAPEGTVSFALIAEDIDREVARSGGGFSDARTSGGRAGSEGFTWVHWVLYNIPADVAELPEGISTSTPALSDGTTQGTNDDRLPGYYGACPPPSIVRYPSGYGDYQSPEPAHRYYFRLYALDIKLDLAPGAAKAELLSAMEDHILAEAQTFGKFATSLGIEGKGGGGFLKTTQEGSLTPDSVRAATPTGEKIYNSLGDLVTPTPGGGQ